MTKEQQQELLKTCELQRKEIAKLKAEVARLKARVERPGAALGALRKTHGGPPKASERCPCGENSLKRALARSFDCCKRNGFGPPWPTAAT